MKHFTHRHSGNGRVFDACESLDLGDAVCLTDGSLNDRGTERSSEVFLRPFQNEFAVARRANVSESELGRSPCHMGITFDLHSDEGYICGSPLGAWQLGQVEASHP